MYSNMISSLLEHGQVKTTERKGKDLRRLAERTITRATSLGDILLKRPENLDTEDRARLIHAMRVVRRSLNDRDAVLELFRFIAPRYLGRPGGYTRTFKIGPRRGDGAPMVLVQLVDAELPAHSEWREVAEEAEGEGGEEQKKGFFSRFRRKK